jgi:uncharacterized membrane protein YobD (UPF0266 family)
MKEKVSDLKFTGFICVALGAIVIYNTWNRSGTLPADFLLGALTAWALRSGIVYFKSAENLEDE